MKLLFKILFSPFVALVFGVYLMVIPALALPVTTLTKVSPVAVVENTMSSLSPTATGFGARSV